jgi:hypothetical protein
LDTVADAMTGSRDGIYVRSSSLYDRAERSLEGSVGGDDLGCHAIRDLQLIDGSMATLAEFIGLVVTDFEGGRLAVAKPDRSTTVTHSLGPGWSCHTTGVIPTRRMLRATAGMPEARSSRSVIRRGGE